MYERVFVCVCERERGREGASQMRRGGKRRGGRGLRGGEEVLRGKRGEGEVLKGKIIFPSHATTQLPLSSLIFPLSMEKMVRC